MFQVEKLDESATLYCCNLASCVVPLKTIENQFQTSKVRVSVANFLSQFHALHSCVPLNMQIPNSTDEIDMEISK